MLAVNQTRNLLRKIQDALEELDALNVGRARRELMDAYLQAKDLLEKMEQVE